MAGGSCGEDLVEFQEFQQPTFVNGRYKCPWTKTMLPEFTWNVFKFYFMTKSEVNLPSQDKLDQTLPVVKPDLSHFKTSPASGVRHMWIGHATSLVQFDGITLLTDPMFSDRCFPSQMFGTKRYRPPPCTVTELPEIDCVVISHNHYDHLDYNSVAALNQRFGNSLRWYVPMGLKQWMTDCGCNNVVELTWWQEHLHSAKSGVKFVCTPSQHWSKRALWDNNKTLWASWSVIGPKHSFFFAGDTGYSHVFKEIGKRYGPFTLSTIPIGAYNPRWFLSPQHVDPKEAVDIHSDVRSQKSIGIHWGTFALSYEYYLEPREKLKEELRTRNMNLSSFITVKHGEITVVGQDQNG